jgi:hypothetical protein
VWKRGAVGATTRLQYSIGGDDDDVMMVVFVVKMDVDEVINMNPTRF